MDGSAESCSHCTMQMKPTETECVGTIVQTSRDDAATFPLNVKYRIDPGFGRSGG